MSRNGSGTYNLPAGNPVTTGTTISSSWANSTLNDIANALTGSIAADGQTPITANLNLNNNKIISLAEPNNAQDATTKNYVDTLNSLALLKANNLSDVANATTARNNLSAAKSGANSDITSITGLTTPLTVAQGGSGTATPSLVAGTNVSISGTWPNQTINSTSSGTVTSVATGNGLSGGTITSSGTLTIACPSFNTVGSYTLGQWFYDSGGSGSLTLSAGETVAAGSGSNQLQATNLSSSQSGNDPQNVLSGTWRNMGVRLTIYQVSNPNYFGPAVSSLFCRVS